MFCTDSCEHNAPSRQQQQFSNIPSCSMQQQQQQPPEAGKKDEVARIGVCFVTERPEGLSIDCNIPIPSNFNFEAYNLTNFKEGNNSVSFCAQQPNSDNAPSYGYGFAATSPIPMQATTSAPITDVTNPIGSFLGYNLGLAMQTPPPTQATLQQAIHASVPGSNYSPQRQQATTTCFCMPIQTTVSSSQCPTVGPLPTSQPQQYNCAYSCITPPAPPQQQLNQSVAVDCAALLNVCNCMPAQSHQQQQQQFQQQMIEQQQQPPSPIDCSGIIPRKQQMQQQQMLTTSNKTDHQEQGICAMRLDLPCFLADCNRNSLPLQPVQQQQNQITQQQQQQQQQQPQPQQQQQHQQFINQQPPNAHHSCSCGRVDVGAHQHQQQRQHKPQQQLQAHQQQQQVQSLQKQQQQQQQLIPLNKQCPWNSSEYPHNNHLDNPPSNNNFPQNNLVNFQPNNCMKNGCGLPCCWHFPRYPSWFWNPCVGFLRVNGDNNSCKNNACNQRR